MVGDHDLGIKPQRRHETTGLAAELAGQVRERSRQIQILISARQSASALLLQIRQHIMHLAHGSPLEMSG